MSHRRSRTVRRPAVLVGALLTLCALVARAGSLDAPAAPDNAASALYTLESLYNRLDTGATGNKRGANFVEPGSGPTAGTMHTLDAIMGKMPAVDATNGAAPSDVASGKTYWGLTETGWGLQTGTSASGGASAAVPKTGQTPTVPLNPAPTGSDGALQKGVAWPNPRFTDNGNGTVTDNLTGLIWLKNANCPNAGRVWATALSDVVQLNTDGKMNNNDCGDDSNSGTHQTDWRLPNIKELQSLVHYGVFNPALPNTAGTGKWTADDPFSGVQSGYYWSSTSHADNTSYAWDLNLYDGNVNVVDKAYTYYVWPVRGGQ